MSFPNSPSRSDAVPWPEMLISAADWQRLKTENPDMTAAELANCERLLKRYNQLAIDTMPLLTHEVAMPENPIEQLARRAIALLRKVTEHSAWSVSALELAGYEYGEDLVKEAETVLSAADVLLPPGTA